jgi:hypothetical protein
MLIFESVTGRSISISQEKEDIIWCTRDNTVEIRKEYRIHCANTNCNKGISFRIFNARDSSKGTHYLRIFTAIL